MSNSPRVLLGIVFSILLTSPTRAAKIDLRRTSKGDRIAVVSKSGVRYLPARRIELIQSVPGAGHARYIRRASNGHLYVMGAGIEGKLLRSKDGGFTWTTTRYSIDKLRFLSAFTILRDDTFLVAYMPPGKHRVFIAKSKDKGRTWTTHRPKLNLSPYTEAYAYNSEVLERANGELLLTLDLRAGPDAVKDYQGNTLPLALQGSVPHLFSSTDKGKTWRKKSLITLYGGEAHLLELPSGKLLQCVRKQRWHRLPGDPEKPIDAKLLNGYRPQFDSEERRSQNSERTNRVKNMYLSESTDGGRTWFGEREVTSFLQCSGDMALLSNGRLVLEYLHRYPDDIANTGIRARISDDQGKTWRKETYILSQGNSRDIDSGSCYPGTIAMKNGKLLSICVNFVNGRTRLEAVHWQPLPTTSKPSQSPPARTGARKFVNSLGMKMIQVKRGRFDAHTPSLYRYREVMAARKMPKLAFALNRPAITTSVKVKEFWLSEFPVTNRMYRQFVKETGYRAPGGRLVDFYWQRSSGSTWNRAGFKADNKPVTGVQNTDIDAFCAWLSKKEGRTYRPPTIREFEFANRAGTKTRYWWGNLPDVRKMNFALSMIGHPTAVGSYPPNPWGFYDMQGNVWQYCTDIGRHTAMGGAFNCPQNWTGADVFGNFYEGPNKMPLLSTGFRLACDAAHGKPRPSDLKKATIAAAGGRGPTIPKLKVTVGKRLNLGPVKTNAVRFLVTKSGAWVLNERRSTDKGKTWKPCTPIGEAFCQLRDGTIISVPGPDSKGSRVTFPDSISGKSTLRVLVSKDGWQTVKAHRGNIHVPLALFLWPVRGLVELPDGRLLMTLYGRMHGDRVREDSPVGYELSNPWIKTRVVLVESKDRGKNWRYLSTVSYNPQLGFEGQNESDLVQLPNGLLAAFMRTGIHGYVDQHGRHHLDQPLLVAWSKDNGASWSEPQRIYVGKKLVAGIYPRAKVTKQGVLAVLRCRPDGSVIFSPDGNGSIWSDESRHYGSEGNHHAGMQDMALIGPNTLLVIDIIKNGNGWRVEGVPITVTKRNR